MATPWSHIAIAVGVFLGICALAALAGWGARLIARRQKEIEEMDYDEGQGFPR